MNYTGPTTTSEHSATTRTDDVTDDVTALDQGQGQGETEGEEPATNEQTALTSRDLHQTSSIFTRKHLSDDSSVPGAFTLIPTTIFTYLPVYFLLLARYVPNVVKEEYMRSV